MHIDLNKFYMNIQGYRAQRHKLRAKKNCSLRSAWAEQLF